MTEGGIKQQVVSLSLGETNAVSKFVIHYEGTGEDVLSFSIIRTSTAVAPAQTSGSVSSTWLAEKRMKNRQVGVQ